MEARFSAGQTSDAPPAQWSKKVYIIPSRNNTFVEELISKVPNGITKIEYLNDVDFSSKPCVCVLGEVGWMVGAKVNSLTPLTADPFVFTLKNSQNVDCQVKVTVTGESTQGFPNPLHSLVYIINPECLDNDDFETQSFDVPVSFLLNDKTKGCIILVNRYLYQRHMKKQPLKVVESLLPVLERDDSQPCHAVTHKQAGKRTRLSDSDTSANEGKSPKKKTTLVSTSPIKKQKNPSTKQIVRKAPVYVYTELQHLKPNNKVNIAGVVDWFKEPSRSRGKDYYLSFTMTDKTLSNDSISVIAFNSNESNLPAIEETGDIVLLRHAKVNRFNDSIQVVAPHFSSHLVFGRDGVSPIGSSQNATLSNSDIKVVESLQEWASERCITGKDRNVKKLQAVEADDMLDIVGLVCDINILSPNHFAVIAIADGTLPNYITASGHGDHFPSGRYSDKYKSLLVLVEIYNYFALQSLANISRGSYVYIQNVYAAQQTDKVVVEGKTIQHIEFSVSDEDETTFTELPDSDKDVIEVKKALDMYLNPVPCVEHWMSDSVTTFVGSKMPFHTIDDVRTNTEFPNGFRLYVRPVKVREKSVEDIVKLWCKHCLRSYEVPKTQEELESGKFHEDGDQCEYDECSDEYLIDGESSHTLSYTYHFYLTIADSSGELDVCICNNDALMLLVDAGASNLYLDEKKRDAILSRLVLLFGFNPFQPKSDGVPVTRMDCGLCLYHAKPVSHDQTTEAPILRRMCGTVINLSDNEIREDGSPSIYSEIDPD